MFWDKHIVNILRKVPHLSYRECMGMLVYLEETFVTILIIKSHIKSHLNKCCVIHRKYLWFTHATSYYVVCP